MKRRVFYYRLLQAQCIMLVVVTSAVYYVSGYYKRSVYISGCYKRSVYISGCYKRSVLCFGCYERRNLYSLLSRTAGCYAPALFTDIMGIRVIQLLPQSYQP